jgi:DNA-directed RNA polymerase specialized sigma24 family protein
MTRSVPPSVSVVPPRPTWEPVHVTALAILPSFLLLLGVAACDLEDLLQEVLLAAYERFPHFNPARWGAVRPPEPAAPSGEVRLLGPGTAAEPSGSAPDAATDAARPRDPTDRRTAEGAWLYTIAWRKAGHYLDRAYRRREVPLGLLRAPGFQRIDPTLGADLLLAAEERREIARALLSSVPPERRVILVLNVVCGIPVPKIAEALELNENTAYNRLRLARRDYRAAVKRLRPEVREALRSSLLLFPLFPEVLLRAAVEPAGAAGPASAPAPAAPNSSAADRSERLGRGISALRGRLGWLVAGGVAVVPFFLAPEPAVWARRFVLPIVWWEAAHGARPTNPEPRPAAGDGTDAVLRGPASPVAPAPKPAKPERVPVAEEQRWIDAAQEALLRGDLQAALAQLAEHARRFPQGQLRATRERLRARAMRALPDAGDAGGGAQDGSK